MRRHWLCNVAWRSGCTSGFTTAQELSLSGSKGRPGAPSAGSDSSFLSLQLKRSSTGCTSEEQRIYGYARNAFFVSNTALRWEPLMLRGSLELPWLSAGHCVHVSILTRSAAPLDATQASSQRPWRP